MGRKRRSTTTPRNEGRASDTPVRVDARLITGAAGDRPYPFSPAMYEVGYGCFEPLPKRPELPPLWGLATSEDSEKRHEFLRVIDLFERPDVLEPTVIDLAHSIYMDSKKLAEPVRLLVDGGAGGETTYAILSGERYALAALWLWNKGMWAKPLVRAEVVRQEGGRGQP